MKPPTAQMPDVSTNYMTTSAKLIIAFTTGLFSCTSNETTIKDSDKISTDTVKKVQIDATSNLNTDTIKRFVVDDFPVTDEMLEDKTSNNSSFPKKSGNIQSLDKAWFSNDTLKQTLVFELYTDKHRMVTFHFYNNDIPKDLINRMELNTDNGDVASLQEKEKSFKGFVNSTTKISQQYFTTDKGFNLGDKKQKALTIYGNPDNKTKEGNIEILEWDFIGDILYDGKTDLRGKPLAKDNYGHQATMFFRNDKLIALVLHNDIP